MTGDEPTYDWLTDPVSANLRVSEEAVEVARIAANHQVMVGLLENLAEYSRYLWEQNAYARTRSISKGMQDRIHQAFERLEYKR